MRIEKIYLWRSGLYDRATIWSYYLQPGGSILHHPAAPADVFKNQYISYYLNGLVHNVAEYAYYQLNRLVDGRLPEGRRFYLQDKPLLLVLD